MKMNRNQRAFFSAYVTAALWSSTEDDGNPLDRNYGESDIDSDTLESFKRDCVAFYDANEDSIDCDGAPMDNDPDCMTEYERKASMAGHDFWLTRCGHGAGFWDGDWPEPHATILTDASEAFGNIDLYISDDGEVAA